MCFIYNLNSVMPNTKYVEDGCGICLKMYKPAKSKCLALKCGHAFHKACVEPWIKEQMACPTCRIPVLLLDKAGLEELDDFNVIIKVAKKTSNYVLGTCNWLMSMTIGVVAGAQLRHYFMPNTIELDAVNTLEIGMDKVVVVGLSAGLGLLVGAGGYCLLRNQMKRNEIIAESPQEFIYTHTLKK